MKKNIVFFFTLLSLAIFTATSFASPDFTKPAEETGVLQVHNYHDFYINGYKLDDISHEQKSQLNKLVGETITIKGYYEKETDPKDEIDEIDEIYVTEIIVN